MQTEPRPTLFGQPGWEITLQNGTVPVEANVFLLPKSLDKLAEGHPCIDENNGRIIGVDGKYRLVEEHHGKEIYRRIYDEASQKLEAEMKLKEAVVTVDREKYLFTVKEWLFQVGEDGLDKREEREVVLRMRVVVKFP